MATFEFKLPDIGEGVMEGEIVAWHVTPGQPVQEDEPMVEVMTDKATVTIGAPKDGTIGEVLATVGDVVPVGSVIVTLHLNGKNAPAPRAASHAPAEPSRVSHAPAEPSRVSNAPAEPSRVSNAPAEPGRVSNVPAEPGRVSNVPAEPGRVSNAPAEPGRVSHVLAEPGRVSNVPAEPGSVSNTEPRGADARPDSWDRDARPSRAHRGLPAGRESGRSRSGGPAATAVGDIREDLPGTSLLAPSTAPTGPGRALATPATRKLARDLGVDLRTVPATGPGGRVTKEDVMAARPAAAQAPRPAQPSPAQPSPALPSPAQPSAEGALAKAKGGAPPASRRPAPPSAELEERTPFVGIRRRIAEKMQTAKNTAAHFTFVEECDVGPLKALRSRLAARAAEQGVKLTFLPFIAKATVAALKKHPRLNAYLDESTNELCLRRYYHLGIATATEQGLVVPVIRDADRKSILELAQEIDRLSRAARDGALAPPDLSGSTFTLTSLGKLGGLFATPVLNHPEVGILGVHQIKERPVVRDGSIEIGQIMLLSLSFDHRLVDGHVGAAFAYELIGLLEDPDRLLLEAG